MKSICSPSHKGLLALVISVALLFMGGWANAQSVTRGKVIDANGEGVIGASVIVPGTTTGVVTDIDGNFELRVASGTTLEISCIGYVTQRVNAAPNMTVTLAEDTALLDEVVVVGFGTQKKVNLTGSVGVATAKDIEARPVANAVLALQGVIPGLNIDNAGRGGELNQEKSITVRGAGTIGSGSSGDPLILIDGMQGSLTMLNPQDIESISVLKDAAASAIYGSRAPFGVILVTTKSGQSGKTSISYNFNYRIQTPVMLPKMANAWEWVNLFDDANFNGKGQHLFNEGYMQQIKDVVEGKTDKSVWSQDGTGYNGAKWNYDYTTSNIDWVREYYKPTSPSQEHNVSISGGNQKYTYYISGNLMDQGGFMRYGTDTMKRYTLSGKISAQVTDWFKADYSARWVRSNYARPTSMSSSFYDNVLRRARPARSKYDPNGYLMSDINYVNALQNGGRTKEDKDQLSQQLRFTFTPIKNWNIIGEFNIRTNDNWTHAETFITYAHYAKNPEQTYVPSATSSSYNSVSETATRTTYMNPTAYTNYHFTLAGIHNFALTAGFQAEIYKTRNLSGSKRDLITEDLPVLNLATDTENISATGSYDAWRNAGFFGRINYDYDGKYLFEANARYDGSSRFRAGTRWILTPSFSAGWNVAKEDFFKDAVRAINTLKLRVSYGTLANQNTTGYYPTYLTMSVSSKNGSWLQGGARPNTARVPGIVSSTLTWETIHNTNLGFDLAAFKNALTASFDYFWRKTTNMVGPGVELPTILGTSVPNTNNTDLTTFGWELSIGWRDVVGDFSYGVKLNISDNLTRIDRYPNPTNSLSKYIAGQLTNNIYGYETIGIAKTNEEMQAHLASLPNGGQTAIGSKWEAGDIMYKDLNGDGKISNGSNTLNDMGDLKLLGNSTPRFRTGITFNAAWKGIDFTMFWQGVLKRDYFPGGMVFWGTTGSGEWWSTAFVNHMDYFRTDSSKLGANLDSYYPRPLFNGKNQQTQTRYLQSAAYMRLKNLQIGYTLPRHISEKAFIQNLRVYLSGENLVTITKLSRTMDPETAGVGQQGGTVYPLSRTYSIGVNITF